MSDGISHEQKVSYVKYRAVHVKAIIVHEYIAVNTLFDPINHLVVQARVARSTVFQTLCVIFVPPYAIQ